LKQSSGNSNKDQAIRNKDKTFRTKLRLMGPKVRPTA
jgi:hypothetical protein